MDQEQTPRDRALELVGLLVPDWRPTREQVLWAIRITVVVVVVLLALLLLLFVIARVFGIRLFDLLKVVALPITVGAAVPLLNWLQKNRELDVENQRAQDAALQAYLKDMTELILDRHLRRALELVEEGEDARAAARARTLTALQSLAGARKRSVVQFLFESELIIGNRLEGRGDEQAWVSATPVIPLSNADLSDAYLSEADLFGANLSDAQLFHANLDGADLSEADLSGASGKTDEQWMVTISRTGATMPNGQKYEDWVKEKEGYAEGLWGEVEE